MSRHVLPEKKIKGRRLEFAYGVDRIIGRFYQIFDVDALDEDDDVVEDKSERFDSLTKEDFVKKLQEFDAPRHHVLLAANGDSF